MMEDVKLFSKQTKVKMTEIEEQKEKYWSYKGKANLLRSCDGKHKGKEPEFSVKHQGKIEKEAENSERQSVMEKFMRSRLYLRGGSMSEEDEMFAQQELHALDIDYFKPLNFSEILDKRLRESNKGKIVTSMRELCEYLENN